MDINFAFTKDKCDHNVWDELRCQVKLKLYIRLDMCMHFYLVISAKILQHSLLSTKVQRERVCVGMCVCVHVPYIGLTERGCSAFMQT